MKSGISGSLNVEEVELFLMEIHELAKGWKVKAEIFHELIKV